MGENRAAWQPATPCDIEIGVIYTHERHFVSRLLDSLRSSVEGLRARLILVDNASIDGADQWLDFFSPAVVLRNARRLSYAENLNRIIRFASARYILLLNTDMYFDPRARCLETMVAFMEGNPRCGVAGCRLLHADGTEAFAARRYQTLASIAGRRLGLRWFRDSVDHYLYKDYPPQSTFTCDWLSGCFLLVRHEAWQQVGGFDTRFRKYFEDVDFCHRMRRAGWQVMYNGATYAFHLEQRSSRKLLSLDAWRHACSYARWLAKRRAFAPVRQP
jgi:hypothetical protein